MRFTALLHSTPLGAFPLHESIYWDLELTQLLPPPVDGHGGAPARQHSFLL
jgi:hypothetical protein